MPVFSSFAAYLRVYEPLTAFGRESQVYWRRYVKEGRAATTVDGPVRQRSTVMDALGARWSRLPDLPDDAYVMQTDETLLICPWNLRIRVAEAALSAREGVPQLIADVFVPPALAVQARSVLDDWRSGASTPDRGVPRVHEQQATWGVPLRWFALVDLGERQLSLADGDRSLRYRTDMSKARRRAHRAHHALSRSIGDAPITQAAEDDARWLEEFHPRSIVELDYGGLVSLLTDEALEADDSPGVVSAGLAALSRNEADTAAELYEKLITRWRAVQLLERSN